MSRLALNGSDLRQHEIQRHRKQFMHGVWIVAAHEMRIVAVAAEQLGQLVATDACKYRRIGDLETVQVQNRKHRTVTRRIEKFIGVPTGRERAGFCFTIAHDAGNNQVRIIERRTVCVGE